MIQISSKNICTGCRGCCIFDKDYYFFAPVVTKEEKQILIEKHSKNESDFEEKDGRLQIKLKQFTEDKVCPFLNTKTWLCGVYENRPFDCKLYPYVLMWDKDKAHVVLAIDKSGCPAYDLKKEEEKLHYHQEIVKYLNSEKTREMLQKNNYLIWDYLEGFMPVYTLENLEA